MVPPTRIERAASGLGYLSEPKEDSNANPLPNNETDDLEENSE